MTNYFRVTVYHPTENLSGIFDSNGMFEKLWQFSSYLIQKGFKVIEASSDDKFLDVDTVKAEPEQDKFFIRAYASGQPETVSCEINGITYSAVKVNDIIYVPDKDKTGGTV